MRTLAARERRTLKLAGAFLAIYLLALGATKGWRALDAAHVELAVLEQEALALETEQLRAAQRLRELEQLRTRWSAATTGLDTATVVAGARAAIENAARQLEVQLGPSRESSGSHDGRPAHLIQFEGVATVAATMTLIHTLGTLGYPLAVHRLQLGTTGQEAGKVKLGLQIAVLTLARAEGGRRG